MEELKITTSDKTPAYQELVPQIQGLVFGEPSLVANLANTAAALRQAFGFFWVGFYLVENNELVLGPFQGTVACTRIAKGKGVCGAAWQNADTIIVPNVDEFPGHIACSSLSKSEIVVPIIVNNTVVGVLDVDSDRLNEFDERDAHGLETIVQILIPSFQ
jgi:GAF domain-containing protein